MAFVNFIVNLMSYIERMNILVISSTLTEIVPLIGAFKCIKKNDPYFYSSKNNFWELNVLITGVGIASTAFHLGKVLTKTKYDYAFNFGIAGSFSKTLTKGTVVNVVTDIIAEMGAENGNAFLKFDELQMSRQTIEKTAYYIKNKYRISVSEISELPVAKGITVNTVHGNKNSILKIKKLFSPDIETMEGAAFLYACNHENIRCAQIRAISNYVEERNTENWNTVLAIKNLNEVAVKIINSL